MSNQPIWKVIAQFGDIKPIEYGGSILLEDTTGIYLAELEIYDPQVDGRTIKVYRVQVESHTYVNGVLSDNRFHPEYPVWYADKLQSVADFVGSASLVLIDYLISTDVIDRAQAYLDLIAYFGLDEFDQYPLEFDIESAQERLSQWLHRSSLI